MDPNGASVTCGRCGGEMRTNVGSRFSDWMSKKLDDDETLHCSDCRAELSNPDERYIDIEIQKNNGDVEFNIQLVNPTEETVGFALGSKMFEEEDQWNDMTAWSEAAQDDKGTIGHLAVVNEQEEIVFEHEFKSFFGRDVPDGQMLIGGESEKEYYVSWTKDGDKDDNRRYEITQDRYVAEPQTKPSDHNKLTAVFLLKAIPRNEWSYKSASESVKM